MVPNGSRMLAPLFVPPGVRHDLTVDPRSATTLKNCIHEIQKSTSRICNAKKPYFWITEASSVSLLKAAGLGGSAHSLAASSTAHSAEQGQTGRRGPGRRSKRISHLLQVTSRFPWINMPQRLTQLWDFFWWLKINYQLMNDAEEEGTAVQRKKKRKLDPDYKVELWRVFELVFLGLVSDRLGWMSCRCQPNFLLTDSACSELILPVHFTTKRVKRKGKSATGKRKKSIDVGWMLSTI